MNRLVPLFALMPMPGFAHPADHGGSGLSHFLNEPDHLTILAFVLVIGVLGLAKMGARR